MFCGGIFNHNFVFGVRPSNQNTNYLLKILQLVASAYHSV
jgi:hypothetical protein